MSEEKEMQEPIEYDSDDLSSFVDLTDLESLEDIDSSDLFGDLGDIKDLGDISDVDNAMEATEADADTSIDDFFEAAKAEEKADGTSEMDLSFDDAIVPEGEDMPLEDTVAIPESAEVPLEDTVAIPESAEVPLEDTVAIPESTENPSDDMPDEFQSVEPDLGAVETSDGIDAFDMLGDDLPGEDLSFDNTMDSEESADFALDDTADGFGAGDISLDDFAQLDAIAEGAARMPENQGTEPMADVAIEEPPAADDSMTDNDILGGLNLDFASDNSDDTPLAVEDGDTQGIDSMLDGLLDNLDMGNSLDDSVDAIQEEDGDPLADLLGFDQGDMDAGEIPEPSQNMLDVEGMVPQKEEEKPGFFKRVFGNIVTDEIAEQEREAAQKAEEAAAQKEIDDAKKKEEKKAEKKAEKEAKAAEKKKEKEAKKAEKEAKKAEKKAEREAEEAAELEVVGKLNKVGVSIIVIATIVFLVVEITGTNMFGYSSARKNALKYFEMDKYTEAYMEAIGTDMRNKDKENYDKIKVVMKVQQSINAYQNYDRVKYYPEALDALLRGIKRYDANIDRGTELEVEGDMQSCRKQILSILQQEFGLSERDAYSILALDKDAYQNKVVEIGMKRK